MNATNQFSRPCQHLGSRFLTADRFFHSFLPHLFEYASGLCPIPDALGDQRTTELPGFSCFLSNNDQIFHTYSTYGRGTDTLVGTYALLDLTALGRQENWEEPKGRVEPVRGGDPTFTS